MVIVSQDLAGCPVVFPVTSEVELAPRGSHKTDISTPHEKGLSLRWSFHMRERLSWGSELPILKDTQ
jgi:hypothetical protein